MHFNYHFTYAGIHLGSKETGRPDAVCVSLNDMASGPVLRIFDSATKRGIEFPLVDLACAAIDGRLLIVPADAVHSDGVAAERERIRSLVVTERDEAERITKQGHWDNQGEDDEDPDISYWRGRWHTLNEILKVLDPADQPVEEEVEACPTTQ